MKRGHLWVLKISLILIATLLAVIDARLSYSHLLKSYIILFRKPSSAYSVFTFGITFWGFVLGLFFAWIPFRKLSWVHRYVLASLGIMIVLLLIYLGGFLIKMVRS